VKAIIKSNTAFLLPYALFITLGTLLLAINSKSETHLIFNAFHNNFFDIFFNYTTYLGDGLIAMLIAIILLTVKYKYAIIIGVSNAIAAIITQFLKHIIFADAVRPKKYFEGISDLYFVPGVENYLYNSFPSGHSTCAFSLYFALSLIVENQLLKFSLFIIALIVGISRIYLSQHFFEDVFTGSLIGVITTIVIYYLFKKWNNNWIEKSIITSISGK